MAIYPRTTDDKVVRADALESVVATIFERCGMSVDDASLLSRTLVFADLRGIHSHGVLRVPDYVKKLMNDGVDPRGRPRIISNRGGALVVDGGNSMGQIGGSYAMDAAIERARAIGIAFAAVRGSNHCGAMDFYALKAARADMIGLAGTNAIPTMAPWGGTDKIVGINPLAIAVPRLSGAPLTLDIAFGATAHGKIRVYYQKGRAIPEGWAYNREGVPTTDAAEALEGLIQPIGQHKGVGLGMMIGILATLLSGAAYGTELGNMIDGPKSGHDGHFFAAINISFFTEPNGFKRRCDAIVDEIHNSRRAVGAERLYVPGEIESDFEATHMRDGVPLAAATFNDVVAQASEHGVNARALFS